MTPLPAYKRPQIVRAFLALTLVIATVGVYLPVRHHEFLNLDDNLYVTENPNIRGGLTWPSVHWALTAGLTHQDANADYWRPLSFLSHALDIELFGLRPAGHHLMNVGIHAAAAVALFLVLQSMTNAPWRCAFVAAIFALHPLRVESVAWVTERKDVLSGLFFMLTLGAYVRYVRGPFSLPRYLTVCFVFALALMSKSMVVTLPFVLLLLDYWPLGRTGWVPPVVAGTTVPVPTGQLLKEKVPLLALAAASSVVTFLGQPKGGGMNLVRVPLGIRIANAVLSYAGYIGKLVWPTGLAVWYPLPPELSAAAVTVAGLGLVAVTTAVIWGARRRPWLVTGWLWYLGMLVPVIGLVQGRGEAMADRFTYLPSIGLTLMLCWSVPARAKDRWNLKMITCVAAAAALLVCAALSRVQLEYWKDSETLFRHALAVTRDNWVAHYNLGTALAQTGKIEEAIAHYEQVLRLKPDSAEAQSNLGIALGLAGRIPEAIAHLEQALRLKPHSAEAHSNLGIALGQAGRIPEAIEHLQQALRIKPNDAAAHNNLGDALYQMGRVQEAIKEFEAALRIMPDYAEAHINLGIALGRAGRFPAAAGQWEQVVRLKPDSAEAHYNLGVCREKTGQVCEGIAQYEEALRLKPDLTTAQNDLAWSLATHTPAEGGDPVRAVALAQQVCERAGNGVPTYLDTLAAAYAAAGRFNDANATAEKAFELASAEGQPRMAEKIESRLQLYRDGHAYRQPADVMKLPPMN